MADVPSTSGIGTKRQRTQYSTSVNWGLGKNRYEELRRIRKIEKLSQIKSFLGGTAPSVVSDENTDKKISDISFHYTTHGHVVYFYFRRSRTVHMYKSTIDTWYQLPDVPLPVTRNYGVQHYCAEFPVCITTIQGELTAIREDNKLYTLAGQGAKQQWTEEYPPMPRDRLMSAAMSAICVGEALIVFTCASIKGIKIMNTVSKQWSTACLTSPSYNLPDPKLLNWSARDVKFYDSHLWVIHYYYSECTKYHLDSLLSSCEPPIFEQVLPAQASSTEFLSQTICSNPALSSNGTLIGEAYGEIRKYNLNNPTGKSESVGFLKKKEGAPIVALPDNKFMTISLHTNRVLFFTID